MPPLHDCRAERVDRVALVRPWSPFLFEVQIVLSHFGFYNESVGCQFMIGTGYAIRRYRLNARLLDTGHVWHPLMKHLNAKVRKSRGVKSELDRTLINQSAAARSLFDESLEI